MIATALKDNLINTIPNHWTSASLEDVVDILDSQRVPVNAKERLKRQGSIPYYGATGQVGWIDDYLFDEELILLGEDGAPFFDISKQKAYIIKGKSWVNNHAHVLRALNDIPNAYIKYYLDIVDYHSFVSGTTRLKLNQGSMRGIPIPIAPAQEQKLIVSEIEKQFSRLDEAVAALKRTKANLKRYKASVLKAAVEGKLTEEWRLSARKRAQVEELNYIPKAQANKYFIYIIECDNGSYYIGHTSDLHARWGDHCEGKGSAWTKQHKPKYLLHFEEYNNKHDAIKREKDLKTGYGRTWRKREIKAGRMKPLAHNSDNETALPVHGVQTGSELLKRILVERRRKWEEAFPKKKYKEPASPAIEGLPPIPHTWTWATLPQLGELNRGKSKHRPRNDPKLYGGPYPFIQTGDIRHATGAIAGYSQTYSEEGLKQSRMWPKGTLCITIAANIADTAILGFDACFPDSVVGFIPDTEYTELRFVEYFLRTAKENLERFAPATAQKNINLAILSDVAMPMPPLYEQKAIIEKIEERLSVAERNELEIESNIKRAERLRQSILKKAFSGRLVPQEALNRKGNLPTGHCA